MEIEQQLASKFKCPKCGKREPVTDNMAVSGTGISRFLDVQNRKFITVTCSNCGYTELYNQEILKGKTHLGDFLDFLFSE